jgi:hypothetical protein
VSQAICLWTTILLASASWVARITGVSHLHLASALISLSQVAEMVWLIFLVRNQSVSEAHLNSTDSYWAFYVLSIEI